MNNHNKHLIMVKNIVMKENRSAYARKSVGDMKTRMEERNATTSTVKANVCAALDEGVLNLFFYGIIILGHNYILCKSRKAFDN